MARDPIDDWIEKANEADRAEPDIDKVDGPLGPPLSPEEIEAARVSLARWQSPDVFKAAIDTLGPRCGSKNWFNRPQLKFLTMPLCSPASHDTSAQMRCALRNLRRNGRMDSCALPEKSTILK
jgi:hypothetical protein